MKASKCCKTAAAAMAAVVVMAAGGAFAQETDTAYVPFKVNVGAKITAEHLITQQEIQVETGSNGAATLKLPLAKASSVLNRNMAQGRLNSPAITHTRGNITLRLPPQSYQNAEIAMYAVNGKQILRGKAAATEAVNSISRGNIAAGVYILSVKGINGSAFTTRLTHSGGRLNINAAIGKIPALANETAAMGTEVWMITVSPSAAEYIDTTYTLNTVVAGVNDPQNINLRKLSTYKGYLGRGYDLISENYYIQGKIKTNRVFDAAKMDAAGLIKEEYPKEETYNMIAGTTISEYIHQFGINLSAGVDGLFGGSVKANFGLNEANRASEKRSFATYIMNLEQTRLYVNFSDRIVLLTYLTDEFKADLNKISGTTDQATKAAKDLLDKYGTHIFLDLYLGGRLELNYDYENTENHTSTAISASLSASFAGISGSAGVDKKDEKKYFGETVKFKAASFGGSGGSFGSYSDAQETYGSWVSSVRSDSSNNVVIRGGEINTGMYPIWMLVDTNNAELKLRRNYIRQEFEARLATAQGMLKDLESMVWYIKDIYMGWATGGNGENAKRELINKNPPPKAPLTIIPVNLNQGCGAGTNYIYLGYTMTTNKDSAVTNLSALYHRVTNSRLGPGPVPAPEAPQSINNVNYPYYVGDANEGVAGSAGTEGSISFHTGIYLFYTKEKKTQGFKLLTLNIPPRSIPEYERPIKELYVQSDQNPDYKNNPGTQWELVNWGNEGKNSPDMNRDAGSSTAGIYIWMLR